MMKTDEIHVRVPASTKEALKKAAAKEGRSLSNFIQWILKEAVK